MALWSHAHAAVRASNYLVLVHGIMRLATQNNGSRCTSCLPCNKSSLGSYDRHKQQQFWQRRCRPKIESMGTSTHSSQALKEGCVGVPCLQQHRAGLAAAVRQLAVVCAVPVGCRTQQLLTCQSANMPRVPPPHTSVSSYQGAFCGCRNNLWQAPNRDAADRRRAPTNATQTLQP